MMRNRLVFSVILILFTLPLNAKNDCKSLLNTIDTNLNMAEAAMDGTQRVEKAVAAMNQALQTCGNEAVFYKAAAFLWKFRFLSQPFDRCDYKVLLGKARTCDPIVVAHTGIKKTNSQALRALLANMLIEKSPNRAIEAARNLSSGYGRYVYAKALLSAGRPEDAKKAFKQAVKAMPCLLDAVVHATKLPADKNELAVLRGFMACPEKTWESLKFRNLLVMKPVITLGPRVKWPPTIWQKGPPIRLVNRFYMEVTHADIAAKQYKAAMRDALSYLGSLGRPDKRSLPLAKSLITQIKQGVPRGIRTHLLKKLRVPKRERPWKRYLK